MEIEGIIIAEAGVREGTSKTTGAPYKVATYVVETLEQYPHRMVFDVNDGTDGRVARLGIAKGKRMKLYFYINAREYNGRWYNSITVNDAREIVLQQPTVVTPATAPATAAPTTPTAPAGAPAQANDLPF